MKPADKVKAQQVVNEILDGTFNERTVEELFIRLRDRSTCPIFKDFGDYIAHPEMRYKGIAVNQISAAHCSLKIFDKYQYHKHPIDTQSLPYYFIDYLRHQLDLFSKHKAKELKRRFGPKEKLKKLITELFTQDENEVKANRLLNEKEKLFIEHLTTVVSGHTAYTYQEVMRSVLYTIRENKLNVNENRLKLQHNNFILCLLCVLHNTIHNVKDNVIGLCKIGSARDHSVDKGDAQAVYKSMKLTLEMRTLMEFIDGPQMVTLTMLATDMLTHEHCKGGDVSILNSDPPNEKNYLTPDNEYYFRVDPEFKLEKIKA